ncbi:MAG TPA: M20 family metallopeptidase [Candidatus Ozemobacteraceae bacterium]|nr:M20 family metallopeptidase [Candidatus Ozemobacteraceae bacterium]
MTPKPATVTALPKPLVRAEALAEELIVLRRGFHAHPEIAFQEIETAAKIAKTLTDWGLTRVRTGVGKTGICVDIGSASGRLVALRADMDALPIQEELSKPYASQVPNVMHACGHDAHIAMALGAAKLLHDRHREQPLPGRVRVLFQPAEEHQDAEGLSGAPRMITDGALDDVAAIFGLHVDATRPLGFVRVQPGPYSAAVDTFRATIIAQGGHGAYPHDGRDPLWMLIPILSALHAIVSRRVNPLEQAVVSLGQIHGGTASNILPAEVHLEGTLRSFNPAVRETLIDEVRAALGLSRSLGGDFRLHVQRGYPSTRNDSAMTTFFESVLADLLEPGLVHHEPMGMGGEDFAYYCEKVPGVFAMIGAAIADGKLRPHHTPVFDIDERILPLGAAILAESALRFLNRPG